MIGCNCKHCNIILNSENISKNGIRNGKIRYRLECKKCNSKRVIANAAKDIPKRRAKAVLYSRKSGKVKMYPCERCALPCYKKYEKAFCTDMCRFMSYVLMTDSCWIWQGTLGSRGYGMLCFQNRKTMPAHRASYILFKGKIPEGKLICHTCDNPPCVNPIHLWAGTTQENKMDQIKKDRGGVKLKEKDVLEIRDLYKKGIGSLAISHLYKVTCGTISSIVKGRIWKHI